MIPVWPVAIALAAPAVAPQGVPLSLGEAIELALAQNRSLQLSRLDVATAASQIDEAWGAVYPRVDLNVSYTRTLKAPNPFAGSDAGGIFGQLGSVGWLAFNESARSDGDPATEPLSFQDFAQRQAAGMDAAGVNASGSNPFLVENAFSVGLGVTQALYNGAAFAAIDGAEAYLNYTKAGVAVGARKIVSDVAAQYYGAQLAVAQVDVLEKSVARIDETLSEVKQGVAQGVIPQFQQLTVEVESANMRTQLLQAQDGVETSLDALRLAVGLPPGQKITLNTPLNVDKRMAPMSMEDALKAAEAARPDLAQLRLAKSVTLTQRDLTSAGYLPVVSAFLNLGLQGNVPDDRQTVSSDPADPFSFTTGEEGIFSDSYWNQQANIGVQLSWNLFSGFSTDAALQRSRIESRKLDTQEKQLLESVRFEVERAQRELRTAQARIKTQVQNVGRAEVNYEHANARAKEGVTSQLELRNASQQLDQTRFNHLQAIRDYLVAWTAFSIAIGAPPQAVPGAEGSKGTVQ